MAPFKPSIGDFYFDLDVTQSATQAEIKSAYRKLALRYHPDKTGCTKDDDDFKRFHAAYEQLRNAEEREIYDKAYIGRLKDAWITYRRYHEQEAKAQKEAEESKEGKEAEDACYEAKMKRLSSQCECKGCQARRQRLEGEKINPPPKGLADHEKAFLRAYLQAQLEKQAERKREEEKREAWHKKRQEEDKRRREEKERLRKEREDEERLRKEREEEGRRRREEKEREEREKQAAETKRKQEARKLKENLAEERTEEAARRAGARNEKAARLKLAKDYISRKQDEALARAVGIQATVDEVGESIGWAKKKKRESQCMFCGVRVKVFCFQLPHGMGDACSPCKKGFNHVTHMPEQEEEQDADA
ncbi:hypothetical protein PMIN04_007035 [Paraphaeosphaeria minitans]